MAPELIQFAHRLANAARAETLARWSGDCAAEDKGGALGFDPVTEADREAERAMRTLIERDYPGHGISGEEFGDRPANGPFCWSLDPIDGTRAFVCGLPTWVTLIALLENGVPVLGVIDAPRLDERYLGFAETALLGEVPIATSGCERLVEARLATTDPFLFDEAGMQGFERLRLAARTTRYGHDGYGYARVAAGSLDLVVEAGLKPHDYNALVPVVRGAGGVIGNWRGGDDLGGGDVVAAATRALFDETVTLLRG